MSGGVLYLLDASVLITAHNLYYPVDRLPEYWDWLTYMAQTDRVKLPVEIFEEIKEGPKEKDLLFDWLHQESVKGSIVLPDEIDAGIVQAVVAKGYADDLTDDEVEEIGRDPFLIAHAIAKSGRCVVTVETSKPSAKRHKRKVPDVCRTMGAAWCDPFTFNRDLGFSTDWRKRLGV